MGTGSATGVLTNFDKNTRGTAKTPRKPKSSRIVRRFTKHSKAVHTFVYCPLAKVASSGLSRDILVWNGHSMGLLASCRDIQHR